MSDLIDNPDDVLDESMSGVWEFGENYLVEDINEENSVVDGIHILARVEGECFFLDKASRNNRFYPAAAWRNALAREELQLRLSRGLVFGTIGHDQPLDDAAIRDGKFSHIVSKVWITEDGKGMAELLICATEPGKRLNAILRAGSKPYVSTRASGTFKGNERDSQGNRIIDPDKLVLKTIDFVLDPGFLEADPDLVENLLNNEDITAMSDIVNLLKAQVSELTEANTTLISEAAQKDASIQSLNQELAESKKKVEELEDEVADAKEKAAEETKKSDETKETNEAKIAELTESHQSATQLNEAFAALGTVEEITESLNQLTKINEELGDFDQLQSHLTEYLALVESCGSCASIQAMKATMDKLDEDFGGVDSILESVENLANLVESHGSVDSINESLANLQQIEENLGSFDEIKTALDLALAAHNESKEADKIAMVESLSKELGLTTEKIDEMMEKGLDADDIRGFAESLAPAGKQRQLSGHLFSKENDNLDENLENKEINEDHGKASLAARLIK